VEWSYFSLREAIERIGMVEVGECGFKLGVEYG